jgi:hypothetical protein
MVFPKRILAFQSILSDFLNCLIVLFIASSCSGRNIIGALATTSVLLKLEALFLTAEIAFSAVCKSISNHSFPVVSSIFEFLIPEFFNTA